MLFGTFSFLLHTASTILNFILYTLHIALHVSLFIPYRQYQKIQENYQLTLIKLLCVVNKFILVLKTSYKRYLLFTRAYMKMQSQILIVASVFLLASLSSSSNLFPVDPIDKAELREAGCPVFNFLPKVDIEAFLGDWTLHHMSRNWIHHTQKSVEVRGNQIEIKNKESERPSETCIRMNISPMPPGQSYNNAPIKTTTICPFTHAEANSGCKPSGRKGSPNALWFCTEMTGKVKDADSHFVIADTDNISWALLVKCFPNTGVHWAVFTKTPNLGQNLMKRIFAQIENFGLDMKDLYTFPLRKCYKADLREELYLPYSTKK